MNKVTLIGRFVRDIEMRYTQSAEPLAVGKFTIALERANKNDGDGVDFINCTVFGKRAETMAKFFKKGNKVALIGHLRVDKYQNKEGQTVYNTGVVIDEFEFVESKQASEQAQQTQRQTQPQGVARQPQQAQQKAPSYSDMYGAYYQSVDEDLPFLRAEREGYKNGY